MQLARTLRGMAARGWGWTVATATGVAAGAGAAQLGLGYGLNIIAWQPDSGATGDGAWVASLAWATWIAATSAVLGAICADRLSVPPTVRSRVDGRSYPGRMADGLWRVALALASAVGALVTVPLVAVPARHAVRADTFTPQTTAAGYAVVGVLLGLVIAIGALASRAVAANVIATASWLWLLALVAVVDGVAAGQGLATAQLGVWQFSAEGPWFRNVYLPGALLTFGAALLIGALAPLPAARRGDNPVGVAISGAIGPLLVAAAYFLAAPGLGTVAPREVSAYWVAPYAVIAGLAGSVAIAALAPRLEARRAGGTAPTSPAAPPHHPADETDLAEEGYAPQPARDAGSPERDEPAPARGQASVKPPAWPPETAAPGTATATRSKPGSGPGRKDS